MRIARPPRLVQRNALDAAGGAAAGALRGGRGGRVAMRNASAPMALATNMPPAYSA